MLASMGKKGIGFACARSDAKAISKIAKVGNEMSFRAICVMSVGCDITVGLYEHDESNRWLRPFYPSLMTKKD